MASSLNGTGLTFGSGATLNSPPVTSIATGNGLQGGTITTTGTLSIAAPGFNTVGAYATAGKTNQTFAVNASVASPQYSNTTADAVGGTLSGTWRVMSGAISNFNTCTGPNYQYLMVRIS